MKQQILHLSLTQITNISLVQMTLDTNFAPATGSKGGCVKAEYKHDTVSVNADMDLGLSTINASAVAGHKGWLAGYQTTFDLGKSTITKVRLLGGAAFRSRAVSVRHRLLKYGTGQNKKKVFRCPKSNPTVWISLALLQKYFHFQKLPKPRCKRLRRSLPTFACLKNNSEQSCKAIYITYISESFWPGLCRV